MKTKGFGMGCFGRNPFDKEARKEMQEEWSKMTDSEKLELANERVSHMGKDHFSVEEIDARCAAWMEMSAEEKQAFADKRKKAFEERMNGMHGFGGRGFGFDRCG